MKGKIKAVGLISFISIACILMSIWILSKPMPNWDWLDKLERGSVWISYWGNIVGAIIAGTITITALIMTIKHEREIESENRSLQVMPYFHYRILDVDMDTSKDLFICELSESADEESKFFGVGVLEFENVGLNSAVDFSVIEIVFLEKNVIIPIDIRLIKVDEKYAFVFQVHIPNRLIENSKGDPEPGHLDFQMKVAYSNLLQEQYSQQITIRVKWNVNEYLNESVYQYSIRVLNVSKPMKRAEEKPVIKPKRNEVYMKLSSVKK